MGRGRLWHFGQKILRVEAQLACQTGHHGTAHLQSGASFELIGLQSRQALDGDFHTLGNSFQAPAPGLAGLLEHLADTELDGRRHGRHGFVGRGGTQDRQFISEITHRKPLFPKDPIRDYRQNAHVAPSSTVPCAVPRC